jgi:hypothetical protein
MVSQDQDEQHQQAEEGHGEFKFLGKHEEVVAVQFRTVSKRPILLQLGIPFRARSPPVTMSESDFTKGICIRSAYWA